MGLNFGLIQSPLMSRGEMQVRKNKKKIHVTKGEIHASVSILKARKYLAG